MQDNGSDGGGVVAADEIFGPDELHQSIQHVLLQGYEQQAQQPEEGQIYPELQDPHLFSGTYSAQTEQQQELLVTRTYALSYRMFARRINIVIAANLLLTLSMIAFELTQILQGGCPQAQFLMVYAYGKVLYWIWQMILYIAIRKVLRERKSFLFVAHRLRQIFLVHGNIDDPLALYPQSSVKYWIEQQKMDMAIGRCACQELLVPEKYAWVVSCLPSTFNLLLNVYGGTIIAIYFFLPKFNDYKDKQCFEISLIYCFTLLSLSCLKYLHAIFLLIVVLISIPVVLITCIIGLLCYPFGVCLQKHRRNRALNVLKKQKYKQGLLEGEAECAICMEYYKEQEEISVLPCNAKHHFHHTCIKHWISTQQTCPICRVSVIPEAINRQAEELLSNNNQQEQQQQQLGQQIFVDDYQQLPFGEEESPVNFQQSHVQSDTMHLQQQQHASF